MKFTRRQIILLAVPFVIATIAYWMPLPDKLEQTPQTFYLFVGCFYSLLGFVFAVRKSIDWGIARVGEEWTLACYIAVAAGLFVFASLPCGRGYARWIFMGDDGQSHMRLFILLFLPVGQFAAKRPPVETKVD